jgi:hypothetical protein
MSRRAKSMNQPERLAVLLFFVVATVIFLLLSQGGDIPSLG